MDLNELFSRHQIALIDMVHASTPASRAWAEECAAYYETCIVSQRRRLGLDEPLTIIGR